MSQASPADTIALQLGTIVRRAGAVILDTMAKGVVSHDKADGSPCSNADMAAEASIVADLGRSFPGVPVVAEESAAGFVHATMPERFFLVDPLDGTKDFLAGTGEFTVNVALVEDGRPVAGAIYAPMLQSLWIGGTTARAAAAAAGDAPLPADGWRTLHVRRVGTGGLVALASKRHDDTATADYLAALRVDTRRRASSSLKFCLIAAGEADLYVRFGRTMAWDTAAGQAVLNAAGGRVTTPDGLPFSYGRSGAGFANGPFVAWGDPALVERRPSATRPATRKS